MKRVKGCLNRNCSEYKKRYFKSTDDYCNKCGAKLSYVCKQKGCFKQLPDDENEEYCPIHLTERQDKRAKLGKAAGKALGITVGVVATVLSAVKFVNDNAKKN